MFTTLERLFVVKDSAEVHCETHLILCSELSQKYALRIYIALDRISGIEGLCYWYESDRIFLIFSEIALTDYEQEQLMNWEFQGAEYYMHTKKAEENNTMEKRVCTLGDRY